MEQNKNERVNRKVEECVKEWNNYSYFIDEADRNLTRNRERSCVSFININQPII